MTQPLQQQAHSVIVGDALGGGATHWSRRGPDFHSRWTSASRIWPTCSSRARPQGTHRPRRAAPFGAGPLEALV
jgi:hypothetical protein